MKRAIKAIVPLSARRVVRSFLEKFDLIETQSVETSYDILLKAYQRIGILNFANDRVSGEDFFLRKVIPALISQPTPVVFDVGANVGDYSKVLLDILPNAAIHAFEPSSETFSVMTRRLRSERVIGVMKGMSDKAGKAEVFDYSDRASSHASLHGEVLSELHHADGVRKFDVALTTLDQYCAEKEITGVDFIKIDTEGNELAVLQGGRHLIKNGRLPVIQFEFNEMNIISNSFLRDFYKLLEGYEFFRLMPNGLLPLGAYNSRNEIFAFQNILALRSGSYPAEIMAPFLVFTLAKPPVAQLN